MAPERLITDQRGVRYGEVLAVYARGGGLQAEVWGTQMLNDCPAELWGRLEADSLARELDALMVKLNGPRHWMIDGLGRKVAPVEPVLRDFEGLTMRRIAVLDLGDRPAAVPYTERHVDRGAIFFFDADKPVHALVDPEGTAYVMQAYCLAVDPTLTEAALAGLGDRLALPDGWSFRTRVLDEELVVDTTDTVATVLQDELENTYTLPG
ncbi:MAG: hypothetical protein ACOYOP_07440 [Microthrixaceae bacterium]